MGSFHKKGHCMWPIFHLAAGSVIRWEAVTGPSVRFLITLVIGCTVELKGKEWLTGFHTLQLNKQTDLKRPKVPPQPTHFHFIFLPRASRPVQSMEKRRAAIASMPAGPRGLSQREKATCELAITARLIKREGIAEDGDCPVPGGSCSPR